MPRAPTLCCCHGGGRKREHALVWMHVSLHLHTRKPDIWSCCAAARPAMPAPITTACFCASACAPNRNQHCAALLAWRGTMHSGAMRARVRIARTALRAPRGLIHSNADRLVRIGSPLCVRASRRGVRAWNGGTSDRGRQPALMWPCVCRNAYTRRLPRHIAAASAYLRLATCRARNGALPRGAQHSCMRCAWLPSHTACRQRRPCAVRVH